MFSTTTRLLMAGRYDGMAWDRGSSWCCTWFATRSSHVPGTAIEPSELVNQSSSICFEVYLYGAVSGVVWASTKQYDLVPRQRCTSASSRAIQSPTLPLDANHRALKVRGILQICRNSVFTAGPNVMGGENWQPLLLSLNQRLPSANHPNLLV